MGDYISSDKTYKRIAVRTNQRLSLHHTKYNCIFAIHTYNLSNGIEISTQFNEKGETTGIVTSKGNIQVIQTLGSQYGLERISIFRDGERKK